MDEGSDRKLYRPRANRMIAGVCGGLAQYFNIDPILMRGLFVLLAFADGIGIIIYVLLWIIVPEVDAIPGSNGRSRAKEFMKELGRDAEEVWQGERKPSADQWRNIIGLVIIIIGLGALARQLFPLNWINWNVFWAVAVVLFGVYFISRKKK